MSKPIVLTSDRDASFKWCHQHLHFWHMMPSGGVHPISDALRAAMTNRGAWANIKPMPRRVNVPAFSPCLYRYRNLVERFFNKLKHSRAVATRSEKHNANYLALVKLAAAQNLDAVYESVT